MAAKTAAFPRVVGVERDADRPYNNFYTEPTYHHTSDIESLISATVYYYDTTAWRRQ